MTQSPSPCPKCGADVTMDTLAAGVCPVCGQTVDVPDEVMYRPALRTRWVKTAAWVVLAIVAGGLVALVWNAGRAP